MEIFRNFNVYKQHNIRKIGAIEYDEQKLKKTNSFFFSIFVFIIYIK